MNAYSKPIERAEVIRYLHMYFDLSEDVKANMFANVSWDEMEDSRQWHMESVYEELSDTREFFERETGFSLKLESVHGPGTERYFPDYGRWNEREETLYYSDGPETREAIPESHATMAYEFDVVSAWNKGIKRVNAAAEVAQELEELDKEEQQARCVELLIAQTEYMDALEDTLNDVCHALNAIEDAELEYTFTREFWEYEMLENADYEAWFTADGSHMYMRNGDTLTNVDTCEELDTIYECRSPRVIVAREYLPC